MLGLTEAQAVCLTGCAHFVMTNSRTDDWVLVIQTSVLHKY